MNDAWKRIEATLTEIEEIDRLTGGQFRQPEDRETYDIIARIARKLAQRAAQPEPAQ